MNVLVAFASTHGSTRGIAAAIGAELQAHGLTADVRGVSEVGVLDRYDAVVLGSAIHDQAWLPEAAAFVRHHRDALGGRPVWLFSVGMPDALASPLRARAKKGEAAKVIADIQEVILPRDHRLFSGVIRPDHLPVGGRLTFKAMGGRFGDFRNWAEIDAWAAGIACQLTGSGSLVRPTSAQGDAVRLQR